MLQTQTQNLRLQQLTQTKQEIMSRRWDETNSRPEEFIPRERRQKGKYKYSKNEIAKILAENTKLGKQVVEDINQKIFLQSSPYDVTRRLIDGRIIIFVGYGQGYDAGLIEAATNVGYRIIFIDISKIACSTALEEIYTIYNNRKEQGIKPNTVHEIWKEEISSVLLDPDSIGLDLDNVEGWYMCRSLFALSKRRAKFVLQIIGEALSENKDPDKHNWAYLTNPLTEDNPNRKRKTSITMSGNQVLSNIRWGSRRRLKVVKERFPYFERIYTSMFIKAE